MKAVLSKSDFLDAITRAAGALPQRSSSIQALQNILLDFRAGDGAIRSTATDLEVAVIVDSPATIQEEGAIAVPGAKLLESVREMPDGEITLIGAERNTLTLKSGKARLLLRGTSREEYPALPAVTGDKSFEMDAALLRECVRRTVIAASHDQARSFLTGAHLSIADRRGRFVATDGHRLAISEFQPAAGKGSAKGGVNVIIPARILQIVSNHVAGGLVTVTVGETHVVFTTDGGTYYSRLIAEKFPDYEKIIPKASDRKVVLSRKTLSDSLRRVSLFTNQRTAAVNFSIKSDKLVISAETPEFGEATDEIEANVTGSALEISFNARYLQDVLKVLQGDELSIELGAKIAPAVLKTQEDKGYLYILMPLRG